MQYIFIGEMRNIIKLIIVIRNNEMDKREVSGENVTKDFILILFINNNLSVIVIIVFLLDQKL